jgi:hypothetical protein
MNAVRTDRDMLQTEIPASMQQAERWLVWKAIPEPGKKPRKVPYYCDGSRRQGTLDTKADWSRLHSFDSAIHAFETGDYTGLGFALGPDGSGMVWQGIDLDQIDQKPALAVIGKSLPGYVERSPSGHGLHAIGYGLPFKSLGSNATGIEAYAGGRYFTVTGEAIGGDIEDISSFVTETLAPQHHDTTPKPSRERATHSGNGGANVDASGEMIADLRSAIYHLRADDRDLWIRMGMALKTLGDVGRGLWLDWSATSEKFEPQDAARVWDSFKRDGVTHKAVFAEAARAGWTNPKAKVVNIDSARAESKPLPKAKIIREAHHNWQDGLIVKVRDDGTDKILCRVHNLILVMGNAPEWAGRIRLNEFSGQIAVDGKDLDDVGPIILKAALERDWIPEKIPTGDVLDALSVVASRAPFHPVRDYLDSLTWDGVERIPTFFGDHCGCANDDYHMAVARSLFVSSVARIYRPGCKVDTMVILESEQGMGKTKLWLTLYGEWCSEVTASLSDKDFYAGLRGVWAVDFAELDAFSKSETTQIKRILTSQSDSYRPHYGRSIQVFPRQSIFVGGTNRDDWNTDATGARRFLPVRIVDRIDIDAIASARDQLWAEAVVRFKQDEIWWEIPNAQERQEDTYQGDPWEDVIAGYLVGREEITVSVILSDCLRIETGKQNRADQMRASSVLKRLDWERKRRGKGWYYRPKPAVL